jgi:hypothetical protein
MVEHVCSSMQVIWCEQNVLALKMEAMPLHVAHEGECVHGRLRSDGIQAHWLWMRCMHGAVSVVCVAARYSERHRWANRLSNVRAFQEHKKVCAAATSHALRHTRNSLTGRRRRVAVCLCDAHTSLSYLVILS